MKTKIMGKICPDTPDEVCIKCSQAYEGDCRAMNIPHSDAELKSRHDGHGMECDNPNLKEIRKSRFGVKYRT